MPRNETLPLLALCACLGGCVLDRSGTGGVAPRDAGAREDAPAAPRCGDGVVADGEDCDGVVLNGASCASLGFMGGSLLCDGACAFDTSLCDTPCGDGAVDPGEACDGADLGGADCASLGLEGGGLACNVDCTLDPRQCLGCGSGRVDGAEECDGADLAGLSCTGGLACDAQCLLDVRGCSAPSAGDGADGDLVVDADTVFGAATGAPAFAVAALGTDRITLAAEATGLGPGDEVLVYSVQGTADACAGAGRLELARVAGVAGAEVTLDAPLVGPFAQGAVVLQRVPRFARVAVNGAATLAPPAWDGVTGGVVAFRTRELVIGPEARLGADARGFRGGAGWTSDGRRSGRRGESTCGDPQNEDTMPNDGGGGGGRFVDPGDGCGQGGGGGGHGGVGGTHGYGSECVRVGATGPAGNGGMIVGAPELDAMLLLGSGGGAGGSDDHSNQSGSGGAGGGLVLVWARVATIDGQLSARGGAGAVPGDPTDSGNGGGGAGGTIVLRAVTLAGAGRLDASGGPGGAAVSDWNSAGGDGGAGRVRLDFLTIGGLRHGTREAMELSAAMSTPLAGRRDRFFE